MGLDAPAARLLRSPNDGPNQTFELYKFTKDIAPSIKVFIGAASN